MKISQLNQIARKECGKLVAYSFEDDQVSLASNNSRERRAVRGKRFLRMRVKHFSMLHILNGRLS